MENQILHLNHKHLEKEVAEIKETVEKTNITVNHLKNDVIELTATIKEQNNLNTLKLDNLDRRVTSIEGNQAKIVWVIITAVLGGLLSLIII